MNFLELSKKRYSVRNYLSKPVEEEKLTYILECGRLSQSAANFQPWMLYVIKDEALKSQINRSYPAKWMEQAPVYIVICADKEKAWVREYDKKVHADIDGSIITENLCLAAADCGLGSCWIGHFDPKLISEILHLPENLDPMAILTIGYPANDEILAKKRKSLEEIVRII
ncbi:MAG: nitroreductase family protein [Muribaculaceae bacterium]|nr:nitroreductase family protein [Muribaculaceae bacterium]